MSSLGELPAAGSEPEFAAFIAAYSVPLGRFAYLLCGSHADADEVVQDALIRLIAAWPRVTPEARFAYTRRIIVRQASNHRRCTRHETLTDTATDQATPSPEADLADLVALRHAISTLPARQRAVIVLRYYNDLPEAAIAEALGVRVGTVKSQLSRATATLRRNLADPDAVSRSIP